MTNSGICLDGERRLWKAISAEVRRDYAKELAAAPNFWQRRRIQRKINQETKRRMRGVASPDSFYISACLPGRFIN